MMDELMVTVAEHGQQIKTLFEQQKEIKALAASTQELALSVKELVGEMKVHEKRITDIESNSRYKSRTVWACLVTGVLSAALAYILKTIFT